MLGKRPAELFHRFVNLAKTRPIAFGGFVLALVAFNLARDFGLWSHLDRAAMTPEAFERTVIEQMQSKNPSAAELLQLYKDHEPALYESMMREGANAYRKGGDKAEVSNIVRAQTAKYSAEKIKVLSDDGIISFTELFARQLEQLGLEGQDGICIKIMKGEPLGVMNPSKEIIDLEYELARNMVLDRGEPGGLAEQTRVQGAINAATARIVEQHGEAKVNEAFGALSESGSSPEGACTIFADYMKMLKQSAEPHAAEILRTIYASES